MTNGSVDFGESGFEGGYAGLEGEEFSGESVDGGDDQEAERNPECPLTLAAVAVSVVNLAEDEVQGRATQGEDGRPKEDRAIGTPGEEFDGLIFGGLGLGDSCEGSATRGFWGTRDERTGGPGGLLPPPRLRRPARREVGRWRVQWPRGIVSEVRAAEWMMTGHV